MANSKLAKVNKKIEKGVTTAFDRIEGTVVGEYEKIEKAFINRYLTREGETAEQAKARLKQEQTERRSISG